MRALTTKEFIAKAKAFHGTKFTYAKTVYSTNKVKVEIRCRKHGVFHQRAAEHLAGSGCPACSAVYSTSEQENEWLDSKRISKSNRQKSLLIKGRRLTVDAYVARSKTVYEFYGDIWHGNPKLDRRDTNPCSGISYGELYDRTMAREKLMTKAGYKVVSMWEGDYNAE